MRAKTIPDKTPGVPLGIEERRRSSNVVDSFVDNAATEAETRRRKRLLLDHIPQPEYKLEYKGDPYLIKPNSVFVGRWSFVLLVLIIYAATATRESFLCTVESI
jgi:hypothetical protein